MQGVDQRINGLAARLMYKAADKAVGVEKTKQQTEGMRHTHADSKRKRDGCWSENRQGMRWMLDLQEQSGEGCSKKSNNVKKLC